MITNRKLKLNHALAFFLIDIKKQGVPADIHSELIYNSKMLHGCALFFD